MSSLGQKSWELGLSPPSQSCQEERVPRWEPGRGSVSAGTGGGQVSVPEGSVKIEVRKENLLSNGAAGAGGLGAGQPLPSRRAGGAGNPRGPPPGWN